MATPSGHSPTGSDPARPSTSGRVAAVHRQTRRSLLVAVAFLAAAVLVALRVPEARALFETLRKTRK